MKNFVQAGSNLTLTAPAVVVSRQLVKIGNIIGVAAGVAASGASVDVVTHGVFDLPKVSTDAFSIGTRPVGKDEDGLPLKAAICEELEGRQGAIAGGKLTGQKAVAFDILARLAAGGKWIAKADWRAACHESAAFSTSDDQNGKNKAFRRAVEELCRAGRVQDQDDLFTTLARRPSQSVDWLCRARLGRGHRPENGEAREDGPRLPNP